MRVANRTVCTGVEVGPGICRTALVLIAIVGVVGVLCAPLTAYADSTHTPIPGWSGSYEEESPNKQYKLVMLGNLPWSSCFHKDDWVQKSNALRSMYPASGMYRNDGSVEPLWTMGYVSWRQGITVANDGRHIVVWGGWPTQYEGYANEAFSFYEDGLLTATFRVKELVVDPTRLPHSVSHYEWLDSSQYDHEKNELNIRTSMGEVYRIDVETGQILSAVVPTGIAVPTSEARETPTRERVAADDKSQQFVPTPTGGFFTVTKAQGAEMSVITGVMLTTSSFAGVLAVATALSRKMRAKKRYFAAQAQRIVRRVRARK